MTYVFLALALGVGIMCGWFAHQHSDGLKNLTLDEYQRCMSSITTIYGADLQKVKALLDELHTYVSSGSAEFNCLSGDLADLIHRVKE